MTNETIHKQIKKLNSGNYQDSIFLRPLSATVDLSSTWTESSKSELNTGMGYVIYFIKNDKEYVGAVVDMGERDLHWYVVPEHRKKGHLTLAMKTTILSHLFQEREQQRVSFDSTDTEEDALASMRAATLMGFLKADEEYIIRKSDVDMNIVFLPFTPKLPNERYEALKNQLKIMRNEAARISDELEMMTNIDIGADDLKSEIGFVILNLEDVNFDINRDDN